MCIRDRDSSGVDAAVAAAQALLNAKPTADRQDEVDAAARAIFNAIGALEWAEGHRNNPIPYRHLMSVTEGLYYSYNGHIYRCHTHFSHHLATNEVTSTNNDCKIDTKLMNIF